VRVQFQTEGGIAHLPGLSEPVIVDTHDLPVQEARELERLIESAGLFELPATSAPPQGARDYTQYTISVTVPGRSHTVKLADPIEDPAVRELVGYLRSKARELRKRRRARGSR
jgi:hypothetical protein